MKKLLKELELKKEGHREETSLGDHNTCDQVLNMQFFCAH